MHKESSHVLSSNYRGGHKGPEVLEKKEGPSDSMMKTASLFKLIQK